MSKQSNALELLRRDHRDVQAMFHRFEKAGEKEQDELCRQMIQALKVHTGIEEEVFYPYVRESTGRADLLEEASVEHTAAKNLIAELESGKGDGLHQRAVVKVLGEYLSHHIREEEEKIFPAVEKSGVDLEALGQELMERRKQLESGNQAGAQAAR
jgi:hemerythrin-like domain-containing protein